MVQAQTPHDLLSATSLLFGRELSPRCLLSFSSLSVPAILECYRACTLYDTTGVLVAASNERSCLSRDLCCSVSCHSSRLYSALDRPPCRGVSTFAPGAPLTRVNFIIVRVLFEGWVNFA